MTKLGYTWYPKDWGNSESVFELNLEQRGLYRELIDMAMLNDNAVTVNYKVWSRKFNTTDDKLHLLLVSLAELNVITLNEGCVFIQSCESRLQLVRGGKNGGKKSRKNKPTVKPFVSLDEINDKPTSNQIESKVKEIEIKEEDKFTEQTFLDWFNSCRIFIGLQSNIKKLSNVERVFFKELSVYNIYEFKKAFHGFSTDKFFVENNMLFPIHFLKVENFTKFLNAKEKREETTEEMIKRLDQEARDN